MPRLTSQPNVLPSQKKPFGPKQSDATFRWNRQSWRSGRMSMSPALQTSVEALALSIFCCAPAVSVKSLWPGRCGQLDRTWREPVVSGLMFGLLFARGPPLSPPLESIYVGKMPNYPSIIRALTRPGPSWVPRGRGQKSGLLWQNGNKPCITDPYNSFHNSSKSA